MDYQIANDFSIDCGFLVSSTDVHRAITAASDVLNGLPSTLFSSIDYKTTSAIVGSLFCNSLATEVGAIVNPIEKGHPDIIPVGGKDSSEEVLRNYPEGLEIKCTVGNVETGKNLRAGQRRLSALVGITWQAHHREVTELMGLVWDFCELRDGFLYPAITAVYYSNSLEIDDWGKISGTTGRNTKVSGMNKSGRGKMRDGLIAIVDDANYRSRYSALMK